MDIPKYYDQGGNVNGLDFFQKESAAKLLMSLLKPVMTVLEFGAGASTAFYSKLVKKWISIEGCRAWFDIIKPKVPKNVEMISVEQTHPYEYMPPKEDIVAAKLLHHFSDTEVEVSKPYQTGKVKDWPVIQYLRFFDFVNAAKQIKEKVDVVLVDGRARVFSALAAAEVLKPGGLVVVHDWSRAEYAPLLEFFDVVQEIKPPEGDMAVLKPKAKASAKKAAPKVEKAEPKAAPKAEPKAVPTPAPKPAPKATPKAKKKSKKKDAYHI